MEQVTKNVKDKQTPICLFHIKSLLNMQVQEHVPMFGSKKRSYKSNRKKVLVVFKRRPDMKRKPRSKKNNVKQTVINHTTCRPLLLQGTLCNDSKCKIFSENTRMDIFTSMNIERINYMQCLNIVHEIVDNVIKVSGLDWKDNKNRTKKPRLFKCPQCHTSIASELQQHMKQHQEGRKCFIHACVSCFKVDFIQLHICNPFESISPKNFVFEKPLKLVSKSPKLNVTYLNSKANSIITSRLHFVSLNDSCSSISLLFKCINDTYFYSLVFQTWSLDNLLSCLVRLINFKLFTLPEFNYFDSSFGIDSHDINCTDKLKYISYMVGKHIISLNIVVCFEFRLTQYNLSKLYNIHSYLYPSENRSSDGIHIKFCYEEKKEQYIFQKYYWYLSIPVLKETTMMSDKDFYNFINQEIDIPLPLKKFVINICRRLKGFQFHKNLKQNWQLFRRHALEYVQLFNNCFEHAMDLAELIALMIKDGVFLDLLHFEKEEILFVPLIMVNFFTKGATFKFEFTLDNSIKFLEDYQLKMGFFANTNMRRLLKYVKNDTKPNLPKIIISMKKAGLLNEPFKGSKSYTVNMYYYKYISKFASIVNPLHSEAISKLREIHHHVTGLLKIEEISKTICNIHYQYNCNCEFNQSLVKIEPMSQVDLKKIEPIWQEDDFLKDENRSFKTEDINFQDTEIQTSKITCFRSGSQV